MIKGNLYDYIKSYDVVNQSLGKYYYIMEMVLFGNENTLVHLEIKKGRLLVIPERRGHDHPGIEYEHINCMGLKKNSYYKLIDDDVDAYFEKKCNEVEETLKAMKYLIRLVNHPATSAEQAKIDSASEERDQPQLKLENAHKAEPEDGIDGMTYEIPDIFAD